jgi:hypothetical protein
MTSIIFTKPALSLAAAMADCSGRFFANRYGQFAKDRNAMAWHKIGDFRPSSIHNR